MAGVRRLTRRVRRTSGSASPQLVPSVRNQRLSAGRSWDKGWPSAHQRIDPQAPPEKRSAIRKRASAAAPRSEEHTSELQSLMRISYAVFCLKKKKQDNKRDNKV